MIACLSLLTAAACAGSFTISYSGGTITPDSGLTRAYYSSVPPPGYGGGDIAPFSITCTGTITATLVWQPDPAFANDPPPPAAVIVQHGYATWANFTGYDTGSCDDGLGDTSTSGYGGVSQGTTYTVDTSGQATLTYQCTPRAVVSGGFGAAVVEYYVEVYPVTINFSGTTKDSGGNDNILIGQGCTGSLSTTAPVTFSNFQWDIPGDTFGGFGMGVDNIYSNGKPYGHVYPVDPSEYQKPNPHWFWKSGNEQGNSEIVSCTAQVNINGVPIPGAIVSCQKALKVWTPTHEFRYNNGGTAYVGSVTSSTGIESVINFDGAVGIPTLFYIAANGHSGLWQFTQLCSLYHLAPPFILTLTDGFYLDADFNYSSGQGSPWPADAIDHAVDPTRYSSYQTRFASSDSPSVNFGEATSTATVDDYYWTYMMYQPPGTDVSWVPLHKMERHWNASVSNFNGNWIPNPPGTQTVTFEGPSSEFPVWDDLWQQARP